MFDQTTNRPRGLDHLVIGVRDLDAAGAFYSRLGFKVGVRNRHPWGTENRIVQFPGAFLELITIADVQEIPPHAPGRFSFGAFVRDALARSEGMSMLVLETTDAKADAALYKAADIGDFEPFFFERQALRPDGSHVRVAFSLAFAADRAAPECGFFVCEQHEPQNFWNPAFQQHGNGATGLAAAIMTARTPSTHRAFLSAFTGGAEIIDGNGDFVVGLPRGRIDVLDTDAAEAIYGVALNPTPAQFLGFSVTVADLEAVARLLTQADLPFHHGEDRISLAPETAFGCVIAFERG